MTITDIEQKFYLHANQITPWEIQMLEHAADVFQAGSSSGIRYAAR